MILAIFEKSLKEQLRNYWILILTLALAPFFVFVYFLINEASQPSYRIILVDAENKSSAQGFTDYYDKVIQTNKDFPLSFIKMDSREEAYVFLQQRKADAMIVFPSNFAQSLEAIEYLSPQFEIVGDLTSAKYLISAVLVDEVLAEYIGMRSGKERLFTFVETPLGASGEIGEFEMWMPGMLILSIIMLMFSATITFITEVDQGTILRLKISKMKAWHFLSGAGLTQVLVGLVSILLTLAVAVSLGFSIRGSIVAFLMITVLTCLSMIAFSLLLAAFTKTVTDVLIVGNFPLFLFMFFSGAAFPIEAVPWFHILGYPVSWQSLMSPTHAISALHKISILGMGVEQIGGEIVALLVTTSIYLMVGMWAFNHRHLKTA